MTSFLVLLAAVAGFAWGMFLAPVVVRDFVPGHAQGAWERDDLQSSEKCPRTIRHLGYRVTPNEDVFIIRHGNIEQDNIECGGSGQLVFISSAALLDPDRLVKATSPKIRMAIDRYLIDDAMYMATALQLNSTNSTFYAVVETGRRFCGPTARFEAGTQGFFLATDEKPAEGDTTTPELPRLSQFPASALGASQLHMALFEAGRGGRKCLYHAPIRAPKSPINEREATPQPKPSPSTAAASLAPPPMTPSPTTPTPTPSTSLTPAFDDGSGVFGSTPIGSGTQRPRLCFPSDATVSLRDGRFVRMDALSIGDNVHVGGGRYSSIFMFTHRDPSAIAPQYIRISSTCGRALTAARGHHIYLNGMLAPIETARIADKIQLADGVSASIATVDTVISRGLFNPQTHHGDIAVNGILASTYTAAVHPRIAHPLLLPLRAVYGLCSLKAA